MSQFWSCSDCRKVQPPANFSQFKHCLDHIICLHSEWKRTSQNVQSQQFQFSLRNSHNIVHSTIAYPSVRCDADALWSHT